MVLAGPGLRQARAPSPGPATDAKTALSGTGEAPPEPEGAVSLAPASSNCTTSVWPPRKARLRAVRWPSLILVSTSFIVKQKAGNLDMALMRCEAQGCVATPAPCILVCTSFQQQLHYFIVTTTRRPLSLCMSFSAPAFNNQRTVSCWMHGEGLHILFHSSYLCWHELLVTSGQSERRLSHSKRKGLYTHCCSAGPCRHQPATADPQFRHGLCKWHDGRRCSGFSWCCRCVCPAASAQVQHVLYQLQ